MAVVSENNAAGQKGGPELQFYYNGSLTVLRHFEFKLREVRTVLFYTPILSPKPLTAWEVIFFHRDRQYDRFYGFYENGRTETI